MIHSEISIQKNHPTYALSTSQNSFRNALHNSQPNLLPTHFYHHSHFPSTSYNFNRSNIHKWNFNKKGKFCNIKITFFEFQMIRNEMRNYENLLNLNYWLSFSFSSFGFGICMNSSTENTEFTSWWQRCRPIVTFDEILGAKKKEKNSYLQIFFSFRDVDNEETFHFILFLLAL